MKIEYVKSLGTDNHRKVPDTPFYSVSNPDFTLNSPVGLCCDQYGNLWIADTGNNRIVIASGDLEIVRRVYGQAGSKPGEFNMPFRIVHHPDKPWMYVSDLANKRIQVLAYDDQLQIDVLYVFGNSIEDRQLNLAGPNGLAFSGNMLFVADEFFVSPDGGGRLAAFSETGEFSHDIRKIRGATDPGLLWPQGLTSDADGYLYVANTGFYNIVRCDAQGNGIPFSATGTPEIEGLDLVRGVSMIGDTLYVPGGHTNQVLRYTRTGRKRSALAGFFTPIEVAADSTGQLLVSDPVLAEVNRYKREPFSAIPLDSLGPVRNRKNQFHFVTSARSEILDSPLDFSVTKYVNRIPRSFAAGEWIRFYSENFTDALDWYAHWLKIAWGENNQLKGWFIDGVNRQLKSKPVRSEKDLENETLFGLLPGALGLAAYHPPKNQLGQLDPGAVVFFVTNFLSGVVSLLRYDSTLNEFHQFYFFGGEGDTAENLSQPQGISVNDETGDIFIADAGNHRISHWQMTEEGIPKFKAIYGEPGQGPGQFASPSDVSWYNGMLYIADQFNNRIQILSEQGQYMGDFGQAGYGTESSNFLLPTSVSVNEKGIFVNDLVNRAIKMFDHSGNFITAYSGLGAIPERGELWMPYLIHVRGEEILVPDCATNAVNVYKLTAS